MQISRLFGLFAHMFEQVIKAQVIMWRILKEELHEIIIM